VKLLCYVVLHLASYISSGTDIGLYGTGNPVHPASPYLYPRYLRYHVKLI